MTTQPVAFDKRSFLLRVYGITLSVVLFYWTLYQFLPVPEYKELMILGFGALLLTGAVFVIINIYSRFSSHHYVLSCYLFLCLNAATSGGVEAPGSVWFLLCPLIASLTLSPRVATMWLFVVLGTLVSFYVFHDALVIEEFRGGHHWYLVAYLLLFPTVYSIIRIFRTEVVKKSIELESLNALLEEKQYHLEISQEELICQRDHLREAEETAINRNKKTTGYLDRLIEISRMEELHSGNLEYAIQSIQCLLMQSMSLESVVIWHFDEVRKSLKLIGSAGTDLTISEPSALLHDGFQETLELLQSGAIIVTPNSGSDSIQLKLQFPGLPPEASMIGCPYFIEGKFAGFFSCRANGRKWSPEDVLFVRAISDALPLAFRSHQRKRNQTLLEEKQRQIEELNDSLEKKVFDRTIELNIRNKQLTDFAFMNAHEIRGPICRLLGLQNLLTVTNDTNEVRLLVSHMTKSIDELDQITRRANTILAEEVR